MTGEPSELHAGRAATFGLVSIGRAETPWRRGDCPKNMRAARVAGKSARLIIDPAFRAGLRGVERASHLIVLGWFEQVDRDVLVQQPKHLALAQGCFSLRTPARPNPIGLSIVRQTGLDASLGIIDIDALDWFNGTMLLDVKPYYPSTDLHPAAEVREP
jgi:tRNA (adenine37-N6)-methyltransferase